VPFSEPHRAPILSSARTCGLRIAVLAVFAWPPSVFSQQPPSAAVSGANTTKRVAPRLSVEQQQGSQLLKAALAETAGLQPDMRTFVLWQMAHAYEKLDIRKTDSLLIDAFRTSHSIEAGPEYLDTCTPLSRCDVKGVLQSEILGLIFDRSPERVSPLLPQAEPEVRKQITQRLISHYANEKDFDRAEQLLNQFSQEDDYPFAAASQLIRALPQERASERLSVFMQSFLNFQQHTSHGVELSQDFAGMVIEFWQQIPPVTAMDAIDSILSKAKDKDDPMSRMRMGFSTKKASLDFSSAYEYRLFELLPIIEQLDKEKAESLLRDNSDTKSLLQQYPDGLRSVTGASEGTNPETGVISMYITSDSDPKRAASTQAKMQMEQAINARLHQIVTELPSNATQALSDALFLPLAGPSDVDWCPRLIGLQEIATNMSRRRDSSMAKAALDEEVKLWDLIPDSAAGSMLVEAAESYRRLGDEDNAEKALKRAMKIAEKFYAQDERDDDPERRFKASWRSTRLWQEIVAKAGRISQSLTEELLSEIPDSEIAVFEKVAYADALLGTTPYFSF